MKFNKEEIKEKFNLMYKDKKSPWRFDINDRVILTKRELLEEYISKSNTIIDLGCGEGNFLEWIIDIKDNRQIVGVDISYDAIALAREKSIYNKLYTTYIDDTSIYTKDLESIDLILLNEVLYYAKDYQETLKDILETSSRYLFISLAMGPKFFNNNDINKIEQILDTSNYKIVKKVIVDMSCKSGIPIRFLLPFYKLLGKQVDQSHKQIYIFEKRSY